VKAHIAESSPEEPAGKISTAPATLQVPNASATMKVEEKPDRTNIDSSPENSPKEAAFASLSVAFGNGGSFGDLMHWTEEFGEEFGEDDVDVASSIISPEKVAKAYPSMSPEPRASFPNKPPGILRPPISSPDTNPASGKSPVLKGLPLQSLSTASSKAMPTASPKTGIKMGKAKPAPAAYRQSPLIAPKSPFATYFGD